MKSTRTVEGPAVRRLEVRIGSGRLTLGVSEHGVTGTVTGSDPDQVEFFCDDEVAVVSTPRRSRGSYEISLDVPEGIDLQVDSGSADVVSRVGVGAARVRTGSGDVMLDQVGVLDLTTGSGDVTVNAVVGSQARVSSGSGDIEIGSCEAALQLKAASGDIVVGDLRSLLTGSTASGDIDVKRSSGDVGLRTASGDIAVGIGDDLPAWLDLYTLTGDVEVNIDQAEPPSDGDPYVSVHARSASGDITITRG
ncbi:DUF4097 family beta strand repeat-containing protein [Propionibacteriaceae bacterium Y2011]|uniref:DUF4097 family beta strand repeat-containing protein n=1 Tax=Microlunatus sp. Y2014 TaxID=3418488 RepID=UPI003B43E69D